MSIEQNLARVRQNIEVAARRARRDPSEIKLLAVSKTMSALAVEEAYRAGQRDFAENRVQEWHLKAPDLPRDAKWHLIGQLQTNKVKYLDSRLALIHSLDRVSLLQELERQGARKDWTWNTLVQVNIARDPAKAGLLTEEIEDFLALLGEHPHVRVWGLMTIGALAATSEETRLFFRELRVLRDELQDKQWPGVKLSELSMGMSQDYETAVEEGATMVRVGRGIFGDRMNG
ncbi:MAG: YggS family pyridoxal phosphate-dependent enzyme [Desulfitobacteriaceae bacterium]|nr:YggS family pyridoxal phosphate-dependent enzyme [Desulfitobacteriaceae bacterium]MDI6879291.1 YggS family pyridoxal phosphate-dependent enzyme [Desulfitobacteriaceae bacterium]MDI6915801.1 YggS family pyridoxal phosphate-dependent enzyme [Desulfitobacteriaceae bacterium]